MGKEKKEKKDKKEKKEKKEKRDKKEKKRENEEMSWDDDEVPDVVKNVKQFIEDKEGKPPVDDLFEEVRMLQLAKLFDHKVRLFIVMQAVVDVLDAKGAEKW